MFKLIVLFIISLFFVILCHGESFSHFQKHERFPYEVSLFQMSLEKLGIKVELNELPEEINYGRGMKYLEKGIVDFAFFC